MTTMKRWPDLRDAPDHPRKSVDDNTLRRHRLCIEASEKRIETYCHSVGKWCATNPAIVNNICIIVLSIVVVSLEVAGVSMDRCLRAADLHPRL